MSTDVKDYVKYLEGSRKFQLFLSSFLQGMRHTIDAKPYYPTVSRSYLLIPIWDSVWELTPGVYTDMYELLETNILNDYTGKLPLTARANIIQDYIEIKYLLYIKPRLSQTIETGSQICLYTYDTNKTHMIGLTTKLGNKHELFCDTCTGQICTRIKN